MEVAVTGLSLEEKARLPGELSTWPLARAVFPCPASLNNRFKLHLHYLGRGRIAFEVASLGEKVTAVESARGFLETDGSASPTLELIQMPGPGVHAEGVQEFDTLVLTWWAAPADAGDDLAATRHLAGNSVRRKHIKLGYFF